MIDPPVLRIMDINNQIIVHVQIFDHHFNLISTYAMFVLWQKDPTKPYVLPGSPVIYSPGGFLNYLAAIAGNMNQQHAWCIDGIGDDDTYYRLNLCTPHDSNLALTVTNIAALTRIPPERVREYLANHLTFTEENSDGLQP